MVTHEDFWLGHLAALLRRQGRQLDGVAKRRPFGRGRHHLVQAAQRCRDAAAELDVLLEGDEPAEPAPAVEVTCP